VATDAPSVPGNYFQEQAGLLEIARISFELKCIWRATPNADLGIDGQLELINDRSLSTGQIVAVQIKSGTSYVEKGNETEIRYYPEDKHRFYWSTFPIPVILAVHDPATNAVCWVDARRRLRSGGAGKEIRIPRSHVLTKESRTELFETCGAFDTPLLPVEDVAAAMAAAMTGSSYFDVSFLELFCLGRVDIGRKLFFNMGLCCEIAESKDMPWVEGVHHEGFVPIANPSGSDYDFIDQYIRFLVSQNLIYYDFYDYLIDWNDRQVVPVFCCPLTQRGHALQKHLSEQASGIVQLREQVVTIDFRNLLPILVPGIAQLALKLQAAQADVRASEPDDKTPGETAGSG
jgi:hypothetical protein